jgi:hypothetical protein
MRKNLIKIFFFLFVASGVFASDYEWKAFIDKESVYTNEAIHLKYVCTINKNSELYAIDFNPVINNENITIKMLTEDTKVEEFKKIISYEFVAFVHKPTMQIFEFDTTMKKTSQESINNTVIGRDNGKYAEYTKELIKQKKFVVEVKDSKTSLVGTVALEVKKDKGQVKELVPYHLEIIFKGKANFEIIEPFVFEMADVKVFSQKPIIKADLSRDGYEGAWSQKFAFVAEKDFIIPVIDKEYFNLRTQKIEKLHADAISVKVSAGYKKEELLDKEEQAFVLNYEYFYYLLTFLAGYLLSKIKLTSKQKMQTKEEIFCQKVSQVKSLEELAMLLAIHDSTKYSQLLLEIEKREHISLDKVKKLICS